MIDPNEGSLLSLDLKAIDLSVTVELTKTAFGFFPDAREACAVVNRHPEVNDGLISAMIRRVQNVKITSNHEGRFLDVLGLGISLNGGEAHTQNKTCYASGGSGFTRSNKSRKKNTAILLLLNLNN